jgi:hypothetical protein
MTVREFETVAQARYVLGKYTTQARLEALESLGINLGHHTHKELAAAVCASREKVTRALGAMKARRAA